MQLDRSNLDWAKRAPKGPVLRLHFIAAPASESPKDKVLLAGKISGINYAAIWVLFSNVALQQQIEGVKQLPKAKQKFVS